MTLTEKAQNLISTWNMMVDQMAKDRAHLEKTKKAILSVQFSTTAPKYVILPFNTKTMSHAK